MANLPHKEGFVEQELRRIASDLPVSDQHFKIVVAEALLILLSRTAPPGDKNDDAV